MAKKEAYKYRVGDWVRFPSLTSKNRTCKSCGHTETSYSEVVLLGIIIGRRYDCAIGSDFAPLREIEEKLPNGDTVKRPYYPEIKVVKNEPFYKILRRGTEYSISEKKLIKVRR